MTSMIVGTTGPTAIHHGADVLRQGGTAADALVATALSQITLCAGCWVSFAGRLTAIYFDATKGKVEALNACYDAPRNERDPLTIPRQPTPSGRTALVPGFMAGLESLHQRFGKSEFGELFQPAIGLCEEGFEITRSLANLIRGKANVLLRTEEGRDVFARSDGSPVRQGELFRQLQLAETLKGVASQGANYMYEGPWGKRFVDVIQREGGKLTLEELREYRPTWHGPLVNDLGDELAVYSLRSPNRGGPLSQIALRFSTIAGLDRKPHFTKSADSLHRHLQIERALRFLYSPQRLDNLASKLGLPSLAIDDCVDRELAEKIWNIFVQYDEEPDQGNRQPTPMHVDEHSDAIVVSDQYGNMAALLHTINTGGWGTSGIFVDGVSIPDSAAFQQQAIQAAGPGGRVSDHGPPMIALRGGQPVLGGSATGSGNIASSWQNFSNVLFHDMSVQESADVPNYYGQTFEQNALSDSLLNEAKDAGWDVREKNRFGGHEMGFWVGIRRDTEKSLIDAGKIRRLDGISLRVD